MAIRPLAAICSLVLGLAFGLTPNLSVGQDLGQIVSPIVTIDRDRLFRETAYGQRVSGILEAEQLRLQTESREIEAALEREELDLTQKRAGLTNAEFRALADAFDQKVQNLREERDAAQQAFVQELERGQLAFFEQIGPILFDLGREMGAVAILDRRAILLPLAEIDITTQAVQRIDAVLGDGSGGADGPAPGD